MYKISIFQFIRETMCPVHAFIFECRIL